MPQTIIYPSTVVNLDPQYLLPLWITISFSCLISLFFVQPIQGGGFEPFDLPVQTLTQEQTLLILRGLDLGWFGIRGSFHTLIIGYLHHLVHLTDLLDLNLNTFDPEVLGYMQQTVWFLIKTFFVFGSSGWVFI